MYSCAQRHLAVYTVWVDGFLYKLTILSFQLPAEKKIFLPPITDVSKVEDSVLLGYDAASLGHLEPLDHCFSTGVMRTSGGSGGLSGGRQNYLRIIILS